jgi:hypothetical protein
MQSTPISIAEAVIALVTWAGLAIQAYLSYEWSMNVGLSFFGFISKFLSYFTVLTNILVAVTLTITLIATKSKIGTFLSKPRAQTAVAVYIGIVGLVYTLVLRAAWAPEGIAKLADATLHDIVPILYIVFWFIFVAKGTLEWRFAFGWLLYPIFFVVYTLVRGAVTNDYPYPFADVTQLGYPAALLNAFFMLIGFFVASEILIGIDKLMSRNSRAGTA